jgi:hypothetical protein
MRYLWSEPEDEHAPNIAQTRVERSFGLLRRSRPASGGLLAPSGVIERHATERHIFGASPLDAGISLPQRTLIFSQQASQKPS